MTGKENIKSVLDQLNAMKPKVIPSVYVSDHDYVKISLSGIDMTNVFVFGNPTKYKTNER